MKSNMVYENFLQHRRQEISNFLWLSRRLDLKQSFNQNKHRPTPRSHKEAVLKCPQIQNLMNQISFKENVPKSTLESQVRAILDEIGYDRKMKVIRWLGLILTKICLRVLTGIYVNVEQVKQIRNAMGDCPVVFVPTHRSYGDFIMMSYVTFTYDIELPAIAAGMDFHGMWGMGTLLRDTGAFFMRRSYNNDHLYWTTFRQYINQLITKGDLPLEFFIEGTRSRSNKSLPPKYGLLTMILKTFFLSQVPDILFVPISINYDRILEENLFAFELLGVPKPKESTSGLFKSMKILKENFGNIYVHMDKPISARSFFQDKIDRSVHNFNSLYQQEITEHEKNQLPSLAYEILSRHQKSSITSVFNLIAFILNDNLSNEKPSLTLQQLQVEVQWLENVVLTLGGFVHRAIDLRSSVEDSLNIHKNLITIDQHRTLSLVETRVNQQVFNPKRLKGHAFSDSLMTRSVPFVTLQIYTNQILHYFVDLNVILVCLEGGSIDKDELFDKYHFLRSLFAREFVIFTAEDKTVFDVAVNNAFALNLIEKSDGYYRMGSNEKLGELIKNAFVAFYLSYHALFIVLQQLPESIDEKSVLVNAQKLLEKAVLELNVHPYSLNLDTLGNCLSSLCDLGVLSKKRSNNKMVYETDKNKLGLIKANFELYIPQCLFDLHYEVAKEQIPNKL